MATASWQPDPRAADPAPSAAQIAAGAARCGLALDAGQAGRLHRYAALLAKWNAVHNLTAAASTEDLLTTHLLDSLVIVPHLLRFARNGRLRLLDAGSGGGLPGLPIAVAVPRWEVTLLDKVRKKAAFLTQARLELRLDNLEVVCARAEEYRPARPFDVIVSRAFASLADGVAWTRHLLAPGGFWAAMKGAVRPDELRELPCFARVADVIALAVPGLAARRHLVVIGDAGTAAAPCAFEGATTPEDSKP